MKLHIVYILLSVFAVSAQIPVDSLSVYFRIDQSQFDRAHDENGVLAINKIQSQRHCNAIADYPIKHSDVKPELIKVEPDGIAWNPIRRAVAKTQIHNII